jgi:hypothetical protein
MTSRFLGAGQGLAVMVLAASVLASGPVSAADPGPGPGYSYIGASYEWTDVKYGVKPSVDDRFNNGTMEGVNLEASLGIISWERKLGAHVLGQYFDGKCKPCGTGNTGIPFDQDFQGYKVGLGGNIGFDLIGLNDRTDLVLRAYYLDMEQSKLNSDSTTFDPLTGDGYELQALIRSQISPKTEFEVGYSYQALTTSNCGLADCDSSNRDLTIGLNYRIAFGITLLARGIIFDDDTGFELGARWYFGDLFGGDIIRL